MFNKVFVYYPRGKDSGGPEALYQLVDSLRRSNIEAYLVPYPSTVTEKAIPYFVSRYDAPEVLNTDDRKGSAILVPEAQLSLLRHVRRASPICWWLSIESSHYFRDARSRINRRLDQRNPVIIDLCKDAFGAGRSVASRLVVSDLTRISHLAQSHYAWSYLATRLPMPPSLVSDYTVVENEQLSENTHAKQRPVVAYNGMKGALLVEQVAQHFSELEFRPIMGMSRTGVQDALRQAMVYLDLGPHPGKDRLPREAALLGCVTIVAMRGAGAFFDDVPIPISQKVGVEGGIVKNATRVLRRVFKDLASEYSLQQSYRQEIRGERRRFDSQVSAYFTGGERGFDSCS